LDSSISDEELEALREDRLAQLELLREQAQAAPTTSPLSLANIARWVIGLVAGIVLLLFSLRFLPRFGLPAAPQILQSLFIRAGIETPKPVKRWVARVESGPKPEIIKLPPLPILLEKGLKRIGLRTPQLIQRWARQAELPPLSKAYLEINRGLWLVGKPAAVTDTPAERAANLGRSLPPAEPPARDLVSQYQVGTFSKQDVDLELARGSAAVIKRLSLKAYLRRFFQRFQKPETAQPFYTASSRSRRKSER
jgi:hypothetical protein